MASPTQCWKKSFIAGHLEILAMFGPTKLKLKAEDLWKNNLASAEYLRYFSDLKKIFIKGSSIIDVIIFFQFFWPYLIFDSAPQVKNFGVIYRPQCSDKKAFLYFCPFSIWTIIFSCLKFDGTCYFCRLEMFGHQKCTGEISTDNPISSLLKKYLLGPNWKWPKVEYFGFFWAKKCSENLLLFASQINVVDSGFAIRSSVCMLSNQSYDLA